MSAGEAGSHTGVLRGPTPVMVFDEKAGMVCRLEITGVECDERESALLK